MESNSVPILRKLSSLSLNGLSDLPVTFNTTPRIGTSIVSDGLGEASPYVA
jgi:hypothetical protein